MCSSRPRIPAPSTSPDDKLRILLSRDKFKGANAAGGPGSYLLPARTMGMVDSSPGSGVSSGLNVVR